MKDDREARLEACLDLLHRLKGDHGLWTGRHGLSSNQREDINEILAEEKRACPNQ